MAGDVWARVRANLADPITGMKKKSAKYFFAHKLHASFHGVGPSASPDRHGSPARRESAVVSGQATVLTYSNEDKKWNPNGPGNGAAKVCCVTSSHNIGDGCCQVYLYKHAEKGTYRIVARNLTSRDLVNAIIHDSQPLIRFFFFCCCCSGSRQLVPHREDTLQRRNTDFSPGTAHQDPQAHLMSMLVERLTGRVRAQLRSRRRCVDL